MRPTRSWLYRLMAGLLLAACASPPDPAAGAAPAGASPPAAASGIPEERSRVLSGTFGGQALDYLAALETVRIAPGGELPPADIVSLTYVRQPADPSRPVLFVFNGGPISASLWLHAGALGPRRVHVPEDLSAPPEAHVLTDNPYAPLDVADMVFFDPASTGFSRVAEGGEASAYFSVAADAAQFVAFAEAWLARHGRTGAPVFILGESYGTHRAAEAAGQIAEAGRLNLGGVFLMGQAVNIVEYAQRRDNILSYVVSLPTLAAIAYELGLAETGGADFDTFMASVRDFAETEYLPALFRGNRLSAEETERLARRLGALTGLDPAVYEASRLRVSKDAFRAELMKAEGLLLGRNDGRYTGPAGEGGRGDPSSVLQDAYARLFRDYMADLFGALPMEAYRNSFSAGPGFDSWDWGEASPFGHYAYGARISRAFASYPQMRVFVGTGYHDTLTTIGAADYLIDQSDWPPAQVRSAGYRGGHMAYSVEASAEAFGADIRDWIRGWETP